MNNLRFDAKTDDFLTVQQCAKKLGCGRRSLELKIKAGRAPEFVLVDGKRLFPTSFINAWIAAQNPQTVINDDVTSSASNAIKQVESSKAESA